jgi:hypothetical protein
MSPSRPGGPKHAPQTGARSQDVPPNPAALIASMRAFGYSLPSAIADLVDNSITAGASVIHVRTQWAGDESWISIEDDGAGMVNDVLVEAMRLGSRSPREERAPNDLGRFGLGLKTAAFSQALSLTVATRREESELAARRWDLEHVIREGAWSLLMDAEGSAQPLIDKFAATPHGTLVLLQGLDRLAGDTDLEDHEAADHFLSHADGVVAHLAMVFHRFITEGGLRILVNGSPIAAWDPFLTGARGGSRLAEETLTLDGGSILVRPHVLPHASHLTPDEHSAGAGPRGWNQQQGFYVYRARRLLVAGDWLGLPMQPEEHHKLARIAIDLDNSMDLEWQIDVRKATARIPRELSHELGRIAGATRRRAREAYSYRGKTLARSSADQDGFVWSTRIKNDAVSYRIDRAHPVVSRARDEPDRAAVDALLRLVEETVPVAAIVLDSSERPDGARAPFTGHESEVDAILHDTYGSMIAAGARPNDTLAMLARSEPFSDHPHLIEALREEIAA